MEFLYLFFIILITSITLTLIFHKRIEQTIPIAIVIMILIVYVAGLFNNLKMGVTLVQIGAWIQTIFVLYKIVKGIKDKTLRNMSKKIITPGLAIYIFLFIISIILNKGRVFEDYDEYNHWGIIIKNMFLYNSYGTHEESIVFFNEYPPFTSIFQYLFIQIKGQFSEDVIITAHNILYFSIVIPITSNIRWRKELKTIFVATVLILFTPMILYFEFYTNILVDGILGIAFTYTIYHFYKKEEKIIFQFIEIFCGFTILILTKTEGIGLAILAVLIIIGRLFQTRKDKDTKKQAFFFIIVILCTIVLLASWYIKISQSPQRWDMSRMRQVNLVDMITGKAEAITYKVIEEFVRAVFLGRYITERELTTFSAILGILLLAIFLYQKVEETKKKEYRYYIIAIFSSILVYLMSMLWMYCTIFDEEEALILASFSRYIFTILFASVMFLNFVLLERRIKAITMTAITILIIILMPLNLLQVKYIDFSNYIATSSHNREERTQIKNYRKYLNRSDKVLYISDMDVGNSIILLALNQYIMMPIPIKAVVPKMIGTLENFENVLKRDEYTHIFVYRATDKAKEEYSSIFEERQMKNDTLYKVIQEENDIKLIEVKM